MRAGAVFWLDAGVRLAAGGTGSEDGGIEAEVEKLVEGWSSQALKSGGVFTWPLTDPALLPSAALTHPNMFAFFHTKKHHYDFQQVTYYFSCHDSLPAFSLLLFLICLHIIS